MKSIFLLRKKKSNALNVAPQGTQLGALYGALSFKFESEVICMYKLKKFVLGMMLVMFPIFIIMGIGGLAEGMISPLRFIIQTAVLSLLTIVGGKYYEHY